MAASALPVSPTTATKSPVHAAKRLATALFLLHAAPLAAELELSPCKLAANEGRQEVAARCGRVSVPLDWNDASRGDIELRVAVVAAFAERGAADALTVIAGGPGQAATGFFAATSAAFERIRRRRDIVLVDQRGTGGSAALNCAGFANQQTMVADVDEAVRLMLECLADLPHDPRTFTTSMAVRDLDHVRQQLGYAQLNLFGISYGTRVAQHYARRYPQHTRTLVLDGVVPPSLSLGPDVPLRSQAALDAYFTRCADDADCRAAYPRLEDRFYEVLERLRSRAPEVSYVHPRNGESKTMRFDHMAFAGLVRLMIYSPLTASVLPTLIDAAHAGDYANLAARADASHSQLADELAIGLNYAVQCAEDEPFWGEVDMDAQAATYLGSAFVETATRVCEAWPRGAVDDDLKEPLQTDKPVLLLSGELDPITPPSYADLAAEGLANHLHVVGPGQGHGMVAVGCAQRLIADFVDSADFQALDLDCVDRLAPFPLFVSPMGPSP